MLALKRLSLVREPSPVEGGGPVDGFDFRGPYLDGANGLAELPVEEAGAAAKFVEKLAGCTLGSITVCLRPESDPTGVVGASFGLIFG